MTVLQYEKWFHELERNATTILLIEYEWVHYFVGGLRLFFYGNSSFITVSRSVAKVFNYIGLWRR